MTKDELLRLAFEALHYCEALNSSVEKQKMQAITAIKEELAQPEREWIELTDEEIEKVWRGIRANEYHDCVQPFAKGIEAKLKEKNNL